MLLAVNVNNTHTLVGLYDGEALVVHWRIRTDQARTVDEWVVMLRGLFSEWGQRAAAGRRHRARQRRAADERAHRGALPPALRRWRRSWSGPGVRTGMPILYDNPREVGADRIVNAVAAYGAHRRAVDRRRLRHRHHLRRGHRARASTWAA